MGASFSADPLPSQVPDMKGALTEASARVRHIGALQRLDEMLMYVLVVLVQWCKSPSAYLRMAVGSVGVLMLLLLDTSAVHVLGCA